MVSTSAVRENGGQYRLRRSAQMLRVTFVAVVGTRRPQALVAPTWSSSPAVDILPSSFVFFDRCAPNRDLKEGRRCEPYLCVAYSFYRRSAHPHSRLSQPAL